jgi:hypothetical protein
MEPTADGKFACHSLESGSCDHVACAIGDIYASGRKDLVTANYASTNLEHVLTIWKNQGKR